MSDTPTIAYDFYAPSRIVFGWGRRREVGPLGRTLGRRALVVLGISEPIGGPLFAEICGHLRDQGIESLLVARQLSEPTVEDVDQVSSELRRLGTASGDFMLAIGGGAAIDLAKAVAAMATNRHGDSVGDYLENVGRDLTIIEPPLPLLAMPTTAGTGAEATRNAVISSYVPPFKKSLRDSRILPRIALVDPELTATVPPAVTAASGLDAITQLIESYISRKAQPIPQSFSIAGLRLAMPALVEAVVNGASRPARESMAQAALLSGMALANSGLGMAHGVAAALGIHARVPHGVACAVLLPVALRVNRSVCEGGLADLGRAALGLPLDMPSAEAAERFIAEIDGLCRRLEIPTRLGQLGVRPEQIPALVRDCRGNSMSGNPRQLSDEELTRILEDIL